MWKSKNRQKPAKRQSDPRGSFFKGREIEFGYFLKIEEKNKDIGKYL